MTINKLFFVLSANKFAMAVPQAPPPNTRIYHSHISPFSSGHRGRALKFKELL